jgi:DNA-binding MarR family transcriptional regulator
MIHDADLMECADCLCLASRRAALAITRAFERRLRPHGMRITQFSALTALLLRGPMTIGALADFLGLDRTTLTRNLKLIEDRNWVSVHAGEDARSRIVEVTAAGRRKVEAVYPAWRVAQATTAKTLGQAGAEALRRLAARAMN